MAVDDSSDSSSSSSEEEEEVDDDYHDKDFHVGRRNLAASEVS